VIHIFFTHTGDTAVRRACHGSRADVASVCVCTYEYRNENTVCLSHVIHTFVLIWEILKANVARVSVYKYEYRNEYIIRFSYMIHTFVPT